ncbi:MAG: cAMP-binding protein [Micrococcales bacterium]|nr:cAMP-binding protein [Micrococcales bacterium]
MSHNSEESGPFPYHEQPGGLRLSPELGLDDERERELRDFAWEQILTGIDDSEEFCELAEDEFELEEKVLAQAFDQLLSVRREQQHRWPPEVRETALTRAFADLAGIGIVARENFTCCGTCASSEIYGEVDDSRIWRGYVYYHSQDAARIVEDRRTYIGYGAFLEPVMSEDEWNALSDTAKEETYQRLVIDLMRDEVIPLLERHGIDVEWDGSFARRILLKGVDWYADVR